MDFISNQRPQILEMLKEIGVQDVEELFSCIPKNLKLSRPNFDDGISEYEGLKLMESFAEKNTFPSYDNYLGAGAWEHHVPAIVAAICSKSEFLTAYTPYQPEASQGMLQTIFEFQSAICALTGMDASNASVYDGASAAAEALLMALRTKKRRAKVLIPKAMHPQYKGVVKQYLESQQIELKEICFDETARMDAEELKALLDEDTAAVLVQSPNFFGVIEDVKSIASLAKEKGSLTILVANPLSYGLFASASELGADIAVGDCQPFGIPMQFGGPYAGFMACRQELVRQLPGRIVGETVDTNGKRGFVLTLQAREQHIRREKATSNICTNQALAALASLIAMLWYGKKGVSALAATNYQRAYYLRSKLSLLSKTAFLSPLPVFNEFAVSFGHPKEVVQKHFREKKIEPGLHLGRFFPELEGYFLIAVTETKTQEQLDRFFEIAKTLDVKG